jgi:hypothetical protein
VFKHGVKKVKTSEEIAQARKEKEAVKIKEYNDLVSKCRQEVTMPGDTGCKRNECNLLFNICNNPG